MQLTLTAVYIICPLVEQTRDGLGQEVVGVDAGNGRAARQRHEQRHPARQQFTSNALLAKGRLVGEVGVGQVPESARETLSEDAEAVGSPIPLLGNDAVRAHRLRESCGRSRWGHQFLRCTFSLTQTRLPWIPYAMW